MKRHTFLLSICLAIASVADSQGNAGWKTCSSDEYGVSFQYPSHWRHSPEYSDRIEFEGPDGSLQIYASEGDSPAVVCHGDATHKVRPYGTHPSIQSIKVQGRRACIVWPSADQGAPHFAELVVEYPRPITIDGSQYTQLILNADKDHIRMIVSTLHFLFEDNR